MVIKVYVSGISGNKEVKKRQQRVLLILDSKNVKYEVIDIAEPGAEEAKDLMQNKSTSSGATIGDPNPRHALPPQIFNDDVYCGDYDMFDMANEVDEMESFLLLEPNSLKERIPISIETIIKNGDLAIDEKIEKVANMEDEAAKENEVPNEQDKGSEKGEVEAKEGSVEKEDSKKEGSVEKEESKKEDSVEKEESKKEGSVEKEESKKEGSVEKEQSKKEGSVEKEESKKEGSVEKEDKVEDQSETKEETPAEKDEDEDSGAEGDKADIDDEEEDKENDEKEVLKKESSPEKSE